jgi:signal transduction histidine kinase/DNA-binding response OmpR family regulator
MPDERIERMPDLINFLTRTMYKIMIMAILFCWVPAGYAFSQADILAELELQLKTHTAEDTTRVNIFNGLSYQYQWMNFDRSMDYAEQALKIAEQLSFKKGIAMANYRIAHCYWALGNNEISIEKTLAAATIAERDGFYDILGESFRILAVNYLDQQEVEKAEAYASRAEKLSLQTRNWDLLSRVYNTLGIAMGRRKVGHDTSMILEIYRKGLLIADQHNTSRFHICQILSNMAAIHLDNNIDLGIAYYNRALLLAKQTGNRTAETGIIGSLGAAFIMQKKYKEANEYLLRSLRLSREMGLKRVTRYVYENLAYLKAREGKSSEAFDYMKNYYDIRDSLLKTRQIVELETRHEAEKKEQAIKLLEQEKKIQTLWTNVLIVGALFLFIALVTIYRLQQLRSRKAKELLDIQKELNEKLKDTDLLKSRFFANVSHEFRTPLSLILAPIERKLKSSRLHEEDKDDLRMVNRNALRLLDLVNQLLDMSKLEVGKMILRIRQGNPNEFIKILVASFDSLAESRNISFSKEIGIALTNAWYDADKLEKIISNVLSNAFKFTPSGGSVTLYIYSSLDPGSFTMRITDTGKGIPEEDLPHVFSPFYQSKNTTEDGQQGTGLGLSLVNELVKLYQGKIELISKVNVGTTISITLPYTKEAFLTSAEIEEAPQNTLPRPQNTEALFYDMVNDKEYEEAESEEIYSDSILIVEDNPDLRNFIASNFLDNFTILHAKNGEEGFALAIEKIPTLILSDVMMPKMNGIELTEKLKTDERTSHIPVVLLTAKSDTESRIEGLKTGADDYLAKPFSAEELRVRVINLIEQRRKLAEKFREGLHVLPEKPLEPSIDSKFVLKATALVEANIKDSSFGVEKFAEEMNLSRTQLFRKIKALLSVSPSDFINNIRLQKAAELILARADTLTQICYSVGFNEPSYFAKRFRKKFGVSPSEYAKLPA